MRSMKIWKKLKMLFFAAILLTATTIVVISIHNQNTCSLINPYLLSVSQVSSSIIHEKTLYISSDYNFTGNVYETIIVEADNIVIDGKGYTLQGSGFGCGFNLSGRSNVTIKNVIVKGWMVGFYLENSSNNTLLSNIVINGGNTQSGRNIGFHLVSSSNNTLSGNMANNNGWGFVLDFSSNNTLLNSTARDNFYSGFYLDGGLYNNLSGNTAANNRWIGFHLYNSSYNNLSGNTASYNGKNGFALWSNCSYNIITNNLVVIFWDIYGFESLYISGSSYNNIFENNTIISTGLSVLGTLLYGAYVSFYSYRYSVSSVLTSLTAGSLVTLVAVALVYSVIVYGRRKGATTGEMDWKLSGSIFLAGTAGGVMGAITAVTGIIWVIMVNAFLTEINTYLAQLSYFLMILIPISWFYSYPYHGYIYPLVPFYPSAYLFGTVSSLLSIFLIATGVLIGVGFYGIHKISERRTGIVVLIFSIIGVTAGALLIIMGNLVTGYMYAHVAIELTSSPFLPVPTPDFNIIWIGFVILGFTFIVLGSTSTSIREMTQKPSASNAAGILSIIAAIIFSIGGFLWPVILVVGFILIFVASLLWTVVFFSFQETITSQE